MERRGVLSAIIIGCGLIIAGIIGYEKHHHKSHCDNDFSGTGDSRKKANEAEEE